jgi:transcriptional regulator with XRE-family HTH domain
VTTCTQRRQNATPSLYQHIGACIKRARLAARLSQRQLADLIGTNRPSLTLIEAGKQKCAVHELLAIAETLDVPVSCLLPSLNEE